MIERARQKKKITRKCFNSFSFDLMLFEAHVYKQRKLSQQRGNFMPNTIL